MNGYYHARRKRDGVHVILWCYQNAAGERCVSCARTHDGRPNDFELIAPVEPIKHPLLVEEVA